MKKATAASPSPRKAPHCRTCGQPRAGHPRAGCPSAVQHADDATEMTQAMQSMQLKSSSPTPKRKINTQMDQNIHIPPRDSPSSIRHHRKSAARPLVSTPSLISLSYSSQELVEKLLQPGLLSDDSEAEEPHVMIQKWRRATLKIPMDEDEGEIAGTLTPATSVMSLKQEPLAEDDASSTKRSSRLPVPLARSMSIDEQADFLRTFNSNENSVHLKTIAIVDVDNVVAEASKARLFTHMLPLDGQPQAVLLIGRVKEEVDSLARVISVSTKKDNSLRAAAVGILAGAAATWGGLAYS